MGEVIILHALSKSVYDDYCALVRKGLAVRVKGIIWGFNNVKAPLTDKMVKKSYITDLVMHDSGGASIGTGTFDVSEEMIKSYIDELLRTYNYTKCDVGVGLDVPFENRQTTFDDALKKTLRYEILMWNRKEGNWLFYPTIHGVNDEQRKKWIKETVNVLGENSIDGWAGSLGIFAPTKLSEGVLSLELKGLFRCMEEIKEYEDKPYHIFASTSRKALLALAYFSKFVKTKITVDSASATKVVAGGKIFMDYLEPVDIGRKANTNIKTLECGCDYCRMLVKDGKLPPYERYEGVIHTLLTLHNVLKMNMFLNEALNVAEDKGLFIKKYRNIVPDIEQIVNAVEIIVGEKKGDVKKIEEFIKGG